MGALTSTSKIFFTVSDGKLVRRHLNPIEGLTTTRETKNGKTVHEEKVPGYEGRIVSIKAKDTDFGKLWEIGMKDGDEEVLISFNYSSRYANTFFRAIENVDLTEKVTLKPWSMRDKNDSTKTVQGITMYQGGNKVEFRYTKDSPNGMPDLKKVKVKGKDSWDDSDQLEFFEKIAVKVFDTTPF